MDMTSIRWASETEDHGVEKLLTTLDRALDAASIAFWMQAEAKRHIQDRAKKRFASEGDDVSGPWAPLAPATIADRLRQQYPAGPILHRTGELEDYIVNSQGSMDIGSASVSFETPEATGDPELAAKFNTAQIGTGRVPARPVIGLNASDAETLLTSLSYNIQTALETGILT